MKQHHFNRMLSLIIAMSIFLSYSITAYALPKRLLDGTWIDVPLSEYGEEISYFIQYALNQIGVFIRGADFETWLKNNETYQDLYDDNGRLAKNISIDTDTGEITYTKEIMIVLKNAVDEYAKEENAKEENGGFYLLPTTDFSTVPVSYFINAKQFRTFRNIVLEKGCLAVMTKYNSLPMRFVDPFSDPDHPILLVGSASELNRLKTAPHMPVTSIFFCGNDWNYHSYRVQEFPEVDQIYTSYSEGIDYETAITTDLNSNKAMINFDVENHGSYSSDGWVLYSTTGERIRVFVSQNAAKNYSVGNRKVYFTENYYNYVPEDLSVSIDDLQKSVDDLQKIIDELLKQIGNDTSEKEIEELLKQILEELRKNPGTGGDGSGSGDINIDIDLSTTNSWLSKIYAKLSQIADDFKSFFIFEDAPGINAKYIASLLERMLAQLRNISSDVSDIKGQLEIMSEQEFNERSDSFLGEIMDALSEISEVVKTKFPFSIPNDLHIFLSKIAPAQPETEEQQIQSYSLDISSGISLYSGEHGGGGSSRPGSGFVDVDHGGGGGSREPVEMREAPIFRLPIVIERYGIEEYIIIDMSPFDPLSRFSRGFFTIIFMVCLFNLTFKVIGMWGDLIG